MLHLRIGWVYQKQIPTEVVEGSCGPKYENRNEGSQRTVAQTGCVKRFKGSQPYTALDFECILSGLEIKKNMLKFCSFLLGDWNANCGMQHLWVTRCSFATENRVKDNREPVNAERKKENMPD